MVALLRPNPDSAAALSGGVRPRAGSLRLVVDNQPGSRSEEAEEFVLGGWVIDRRVVVVALASLIAVMGGLFAVRGVQGAPSAATWEGVSQASQASQASSAGSVEFVTVGPGDRVMVAKPGDSMWSIAKTIAPESDPRPVVEVLVAANGGESLRIGQQIVIPEQLLD